MKPKKRSFQNKKFAKEMTNFLRDDDEWLIVGFSHHLLLVPFLKLSCLCRTLSVCVLCRANGTSRQKWFSLIREENWIYRIDHFDRLTQPKTLLTPRGLNRSFTVCHCEKSTKQTKKRKKTVLQAAIESLILLWQRQRRGLRG